VEEFLRDWGYLGVFLGILATGVGFPMPEELPVVIGGALSGGSHATWWVMLPVCIVGVIIGDSFLYGIGRFWGSRLVQRPFIKKRLLPPERLASITENFQKYGIKILLFARMTPGIRAPIFLTAGITRLPLAKFLIADGIYAVPGVSFLFFLGYWFTESMVDLIERNAQTVKAIVILVLVLAVAGYFIYRFLRRPVVTGDPHEMPPLVEQVTHKLEQMSTIILHPHHHKPPSPPGSPKPTTTTPDPPASTSH